jgi:hypothetical protein
MNFEADYDPRCAGDRCWQAQIHFPRTAQYRYGHHLLVLVFRKTVEEVIVALHERYGEGVEIKSISSVGSRAVIAP